MGDRHRSKLLNLRESALTCGSIAFGPTASSLRCRRARRLGGRQDLAQLALHAAMSTLMPASMTMPHHASAADVSADGTKAAW